MKRHKILYFITLILLVINIVNASEDLPLVQILNKTPEDSIRVISYKMELNFSSNQMFKITTINLCNLSNREINCLLALQLSENEYVYDIAIEIDSLLRHGIIFENNQSYNLYEKYYDNNEIVQKIDGSLKNIYQLPIKDFKGNSYKKIQIKSKKNLPLIDNKFKYFLELKYSTICDTFQFIVKSSDKPVKAIYKLNNQEKILVSNDEKIFDKNNIMNFSVEAEVNFDSRMYFNVEDNKKYFHIIDTNKIEKRPKVLPRKLCIYWDVSASNLSVNTNRIIEIIEKYIRKIGRVTVFFQLLMILKFQKNVLE
ncbi:MAG: hypothetical protein IPL95_06430 [Saprospiraceae bacterium]|nr:hypothetical protein [Saprospiraceae bacterium]